MRRTGDDREIKAAARFKRAGILGGARHLLVTPTLHQWAQPMLNEWNLKRKERLNVWSNAVDDYSLWDDEEDKENEDDRPLLHFARKENSGSHSVENTVIVNKDNKRVNAVKIALAKTMTTSREGSDSEIITTGSKHLDGSSARLTDTQSKAKAVPRNTTQTPWQYTKKTPLPTVPVIVHQGSTLTATIEGDTPKQVESLPQYVYRKPSSLRGPTQQTIRLPFAEVDDGETRRKLEEGPPETARRPQYPPSNERYSSNSSTSSRLFDSKSSSSSHTLPSSSPFSSNYTIPERAATYSSAKRSASSQSHSPSKRPTPARVTYRKGTTDQTLLAFAPMKRSPSRGKTSSIPLRSTLSRNYPSASFDSATTPPSVSRRMSPPQQTPRTCPRQTFDYQSRDNQSDQHTLSRPTYRSTAFRPALSTPSSSSRSAIDEAVDREFYQSFHNSPARERIAADYQASRDNNPSSSRWPSQIRSEEERRVQYYPDVFDKDPAHSLQASKEKLESFGWSTGQKGAAIRERDLPSAPRLGAASRSRSREISARAAREQRERQQQQQHTIRTASSDNGRTYHRAISLTSETSDEFDCDFDIDEIREEDLVRLEAK